MWHVLKCSQFAFELIKLILSVCLIDILQVEQVLSHSMVLKLEIDPIDNMYSRLQTEKHFTPNCKVKTAFWSGKYNEVENSD